MHRGLRMVVRSFFSLLFLLFATRGAFYAVAAQSPSILTLDRGGNLQWTNVFTKGTLTIETNSAINGPWFPLTTVYTSNSAATTRFALNRTNTFLRLAARDISGTPQGYPNLVASYGILETVAGNGAGSISGVNYWSSSFEGGPATNAALSRPHFAMADNAGNIFIVDKDSHSVLKVNTVGNIFTVAGTHVSGNGKDGAATATSVQLNSPNGLWVRGDGVVYVLDTDNGKVRRLSTNGVMTTLFTDTSGITGGRGLWVNASENLVYYGSGTVIKRWTPTGGIIKVNDQFVDLGNFVVDPDGFLVTTDRGDNRVFRIAADGTRTIIAGNGGTFGGGDGLPALESSVYGVRGIWFLPNRGYLLATHEGSELWYVDEAGIIHLFCEGHKNFHSGDGDFFQSPGYKLSELRAVSMTSTGDIIITESDFGYIRRIRFGPLPP